MEISFLYIKIEKLLIYDVLSYQSTFITHFNPLLINTYVFVIDLIKDSKMLHNHQNIYTQVK